MASKNNTKAKRVKYLLVFIYLLEFIYILVMPELIALYIFINTVLQGFVLVYLLKDKQTIEIKRENEIKRTPKT